MSLSELVTTLVVEGAKGNGNKRTSLDKMTIFGVGVLFLSCNEDFAVNKKWKRARS